MVIKKMEYFIYFVFVCVHIYTIYVYDSMKKKMEKMKKEHEIEIDVLKNKLNNDMESHKKLIRFFEKSNVKNYNLNLFECQKLVLDLKNDITKIFLAMKEDIHHLYYYFGNLRELSEYDAKYFRYLISIKKMIYGYDNVKLLKIEVKENVNKKVFNSDFEKFMTFLK